MRTTSALLAALALVFTGCATSALPDPPTPANSPGPAVSVTVSYPGANAQVVADTVLAPLVEQIDGAEGLERLEAEARNDGSCVIVARFGPKTTPATALVLVQNRVALATPVLPELCKRGGVTVRRGDLRTFPTHWVAITSPNGSHNALYLSNFATIQVLDELRRLPGVTDARQVSANDYSMRVWIDPEKMAARGLTASDVVAAVREQNVQVAAGQIGQPPTPAGQAFQFTLTTQGKLSSAEEFGSVVVRTGADGKVTYLKDVARLELGSNSDGFATVNGRPAALLAVTADKPVGEAIQKKLASLDKLPSDVQLELALDSTSDAPTAVVELRLPDAASRERTRAVTARAEKILRGLRGQPGCIAFSAQDANVSLVLVKLPRANPPTTADIHRALAEIQEAAVRVSDLTRQARPFPVRLALTDTGNRGRELLHKLADAVAKRLTDEGLVTDAAVEPRDGVPQLTVDIDRTKLKSLGVAMADVTTTLETYLGGLYVNDFNKFGRTWQVQIQADGKFRTTADDLKKLQVRDKDGKMVPLGSFVALRDAAGPVAVYWVGLSPALRITADPPAGKSAAAVAAKCIELVAAERKKLGLTDGYQIVNLTEPDGK